MGCQVCSKKLRADNKIGFCRKHRNLSENRKNYIKNYANQHKDKIRHIKQRHQKRATKRYLERLKSDPVFKLGATLRTRLNSALKRRGKTKASAVKNLGCTIQEFKTYLEKLFKPGMTWENHGKWHIDHIRPLKSFDLFDDEQVKLACHYSNLQPLWAHENIKKRDRI